MTAIVFSLANVYAVARSTGAAHSKCVDLIKAGNLVWRDADGNMPEATKAVAVEFRLGRIASYLGLKTREAAVAVNEAKYWIVDAVDPSERRTQREQQAYNAAKSAWEHVARQAGMTPRSNGAQSNPARTKGAATKAAAKPASEAGKASEAPFALPKAKKPEDATAFALRIGNLLGTYQKANGKLVAPSLAALFQEFQGKVKRIAAGYVDGAEIAKAA